MPKLQPGTIVPTPEEDHSITTAAAQDADALPHTDAEWASVMPLRGRGRPAGSGAKVATNIRLDRDLVEAFKGTGDGWQTRINDALREWAKQHALLAR